MLPSLITEISIAEIRAVPIIEMNAKFLNSEGVNPPPILERVMPPEIEAPEEAAPERSILLSILFIRMLILKLKANNIGAATNEANPTKIE